MPSPIPFSFITPVLNSMIERIIDDVKGNWTYDNYIKDCKRLFYGLNKWKSKDNKREIILVAGDIHIGSFSEITYNNIFLGYQLITSPISNKLPRKYETACIDIIKGIPQKIGKTIVKQKECVYNRNYGIIEDDIYSKIKSSPN